MAYPKHHSAEHRLALARWVASEILPYEARVRSWLSRSRIAACDADELIQEAYCRIAMLDAVDHIEVPYAYFFSITKNLLFRKLKRERIVRLEALAEIESLRDESASTEHQVAVRIAYEKLLAFAVTLPDPCRRVFELRKIRGWSQKDIASHLGLTEKAVEKQVWVAVRELRLMWGRAEQRSEQSWAREQAGGRP